MAFAVRRLVLRARSVNSRRVTSSTAQSLPQHIARRTFTTSSRWSDDKSSDPPKQSDSAAPPTKKNSKSTTSAKTAPKQLSAKEAPGSTKGDDANVKVLPDVERREKRDAAIKALHAQPEWKLVEERAKQLAKELGRPLDEYEHRKIQGDLAMHLAESGQMDALRYFMAADGSSPEEINEMEDIVGLQKQLGKEEMQFEQLAEALEQAGSDPAVLDPLLDKLALTREDLESGRIVREGLNGIDTSDMRAENEDQLERQIYEKMLRLQGISETEIVKEREQDAVEEVMMDQDQHTQRAVEMAKLRSIANDEGLLRSLQMEGSLHPLWTRLGWNARDGSAVRRDMNIWNQILLLASPDSRKVLQQVRDRDRQFSNDFYGDDQMKLTDTTKREKPGFWNYDDPGMGEDEVFQQDDLPRAGHQELELKREIRHYSRMMVWELPLLSKLAKPFSPPAQEQLLRFRYTTYMGREHPSEQKIVVEFSPSSPALSLTKVQRNKLIKLAGPRYNPSTDIVKISCESFETAAQNKRYLGDQVEILIKEAKDAKDTFEDVPFDFRHHKPKPFHTFPEAWKVTPERRASLIAARAQAKALDEARASTGQQVDGKLHLPGGIDQRTIEANRAAQVKAERALLPESSEILTEREREALLVQQTGRMKSDKLVRVADRKARRPAKRDRHVSHAMALQRRLGPQAVAAPASITAMPEPTVHSNIDLSTR